MDPIERIRLSQAQKQVNGILDRRVSSSSMAMYKERDANTGDRLMTTPDGGVIRQGWIANSKPDSIPALTIPSKQVGLSGFTTQKPA